MHHPRDDGEEKGAAGISHDIIDIRSSARDEMLMELIQQSVNDCEDESSQQRVPAQEREVRLMEERPPAEPAEDEEHERVPDLVRSLGNAEQGRQFWNGGKDKNGEDPEEWRQLISDEALQNPLTHPHF